MVFAWPQRQPFRVAPRRNVARFAQGVPQDGVGDSWARDRRFTLQVYGHVSENIRDETTEAFDQMFGDKGTVSGAVVGVVVGPKIQMNC